MRQKKLFKNFPGQKSIHHRKPLSIGGENRIYNLSLVTRKQHEAWHLLFENKNAHDIAQIINEVWLDTEYYFMCVERKKVKMS